MFLILPEWPRQHLAGKDHTARSAAPLDVHELASFGREELKLQVPVMDAFSGNLT